MSRWNPTSRENVDGFVCFVHIVAIMALYISDPSFVDKIVGRLLLVMEVTTILFHAFYSLSFNTVALQRLSWTPSVKQWNSFKWLEYAVSLSAGTGPRQCALLTRPAGVCHARNFCGGLRRERHAQL